MINPIALHINNPLGGLEGSKAGRLLCLWSWKLIGVDSDSCRSSYPAGGQHTVRGMRTASVGGLTGKGRQSGGGGTGATLPYEMKIEL